MRVRVRLEVAYGQCTGFTHVRRGARERDVRETLGGRLCLEPHRVSCCLQLPDDADSLFVDRVPDFLVHQAVQVAGNGDVALVQAADPGSAELPDEIAELEYHVGSGSTFGCTLIFRHALSCSPSLDVPLTCRFPLPPALVSPLQTTRSTRTWMQSRDNNPTPTCLRRLPAEGREPAPRASTTIRQTLPTIRLAGLSSLLMQIAVSLIGAPGSIARGVLSMRLPGRGPGRLLPRIDYCGYVTGTLPMRASQTPSSLKARMAPGWAFSSVSPSSIILSVMIAPSALSLRISPAYL